MTGKVHEALRRSMTAAPDIPGFSMAFRGFAMDFARAGMIRGRTTWATGGVVIELEGVDTWLMRAPAEPG